MTAATHRPFTGRHMSYIMLGFFAVVFTANMTMVYFAKASWTGLVVANSYVASQSFNSDTARLKAFRDMGIEPALTFDKGELRVKFVAQSGATPNVI